MKEILTIMSPVKHKLEKRSKRKRFYESGKQNENLLKDNGENLNKEKVKKIKIRLADPNIPDSYICEVFDSSLERDEEDEDNNGFRGMDELKQRNYFDVLMSKDSRRNFTINTAAQNEQIPEETKLFREVESDVVAQKRKTVKARNKEKLVELINMKKKKVNSYCSNSSDDEVLFDVQSSIQFIATNSKEKNPPNSDPKAKNKENTGESVLCNNEDFSKSDTTSLLPKKNSNILNYFSKSDTRTVKAPVKRTEANGQLKLRKLTEIDMFENSRKDSSPGGENYTEMKPENVKLAPLFQKKVKRVVDPKIQKARLDFLKNGVPTNMKKIGDNRKNLEDTYPGGYFPDVVHVQQKDDDPLWYSEDVIIPLLMTEEHSVYRSRGKTFRFKIMEEGLPRMPDKQCNQSSLKNLRLRYRDLNIDSMFSGFKQNKYNFVQKMKMYESGINCDDSIEIVPDCNVGNSCYSLWTEVYRPKSCEIMGNKLTVARLSGWLKSWKEYNSEVKKSNGRVKSRTLLSSDESDDFLSTYDDSTSLGSPVNICLLSGPIASGKTALVYALASEFDYNVLEVNASSRRTGKKLLLDLQEATKSHQVGSGFNSVKIDARRKQQKNKKKIKKKKKRKISSNINETNNSKISLILIEDADIFFEDHDEGFVSAISTLVQSSKRPFIFLSNDPNYGYLERLKQQQILLLEMQRPNFQNACAVLDVIAALEGITLDRKTLGNLVLLNEYDLRKSILELQFWTQSGKELIRDLGNTSELGKLWWGLNKFLYKKDSAHVVKLDYTKRKRSSDLYDASEEETEEASKKAKLIVGVTKASARGSTDRKSDSSIHAYTRILDSVSVSDMFKYGSDHEPTPLIEYRAKDGLSLSECMESVDWKVKDLSGSIIEELVHISARVFASCNGRDRECMLSNPSWSEIRWRNLQKDAKQDLVSLLPSNSGNSKRNIYLDYLPVIRNMCRAEKTRYIGNTKRKNRFNHYFRTLGCDPRDETLEISCDILDI